jgi:hypothetical protein
MRRKYGRDKEYSFGIYEYYTGGGQGPGWTRDEMAPVGDTLKELRGDYKYMAEAFRHPVLDYETGKPVGDHDDSRTA